MTNHLLNVSANLSGRDFVCGDLHGQQALLQQALEKQDFDKAKDRLFALGDLVDRGEQSPEVFQLLEEPWFFSIRGNHEQLMFDALENLYPQDIALWMNNGGSHWVDNAEKFHLQHPELQIKIDQQRDSLPWAIELELRDGRHLGLVHAEVPGDDWHAFLARINDQDLQAGQMRYQAVWSRQIRDQGYSGPVANIDLCVHGHCMFVDPVRHFNRCYIDTGASLQRKRLWGLKQEQLGYLSVIQAEELFAITERPHTEIRQLSWSRQRI